MPRAFSTYAEESLSQDQMDKPIVHVAIIEDERAIRESLTMLLDGSPGYCARGVFSSMEEALATIIANPPDVVLADLGLPGMPGSEGIRKLRERFPSLAILVLTVYDDDQRIFQAICAGALGYLLKKARFPHLLECIDEVMKGGAPMSPEVARRVLYLFRQIRPPERADYALTAHEGQVLKLLVAGHSYKTAAAELGVSGHNVSFHLRHIYEKLQVHSKSEAVSKALRSGLVD
jgi:DNA-binding NarL/FixJ family response regulator